MRAVGEIPAEPGLFVAGLDGAKPAAVLARGVVVERAGDGVARVRRRSGDRPGEGVGQVRHRPDDGGNREPAPGGRRPVVVEHLVAGEGRVAGRGRHGSDAGRREVRHPFEVVDRGVDRFRDVPPVAPRAGPGRVRRRRLVEFDLLKSVILVAVVPARRDRPAVGRIRRLVLEDVEARRGLHPAHRAGDRVERCPGFAAVVGAFERPRGRRAALVRLDVRHERIGAHDVRAVREVPADPADRVAGLDDAEPAARPGRDVVVEGVGGRIARKDFGRGRGSRERVRQVGRQDVFIRRNAGRGRRGKERERCEREKRGKRDSFHGTGLHGGDRR